MFIAVVNQKGGVGKTTLAVHLAAWFYEGGSHVALIDADGQGSSSNWMRAAEAGVTLVAEQNADGVMEHAARLCQSHDLVIADGPANLSETTRALLLVADLAILPCGVTLPELESTAATVRILRNAQAVRRPGLPPGLVVLTRVRDNRFHLTREARSAAETLGLTVCSSTLRLREAVADAPGQRTVAWRMGRTAKPAANEMIQLMQEILAHAHAAPHHAARPDLRAASLPQSA